MWVSYAKDRPGLIAGISAMPSLHVAISFWMILAARSIAPRLTWLAVAYFLFVWIASVHLGWHYLLDGAAGALGVLGIWVVAQPLERRIAHGRTARSGAINARLAPTENNLSRE
jgi:membrane-associated phospholipid phosphatase